MQSVAFSIHLFSVNLCNSYSRTKKKFSENLVAIFVFVFFVILSRVSVEVNPHRQNGSVERFE